MFKFINMDAHADENRIFCIDESAWLHSSFVLLNKRRHNLLGEVNKYSGLLYCSDCGSSLSLLCKKSKGGRIGFQCSNYRNHSGCSICTPHRIRDHGENRRVKKKGQMGNRLNAHLSSNPAEM